MRSCDIPYALISDRDYLHQIGTTKLKELFSPDNRKIKKNVIDDPSSLDGDSLCLRLEEAIASKKIDHLEVLWIYVKSRRRKLRENLDEKDQKLIDEFISSKRTEYIFILSKGDLEKYLPLGYRSKNLEKLIDLLKTDYWHKLESSVQREIILIAEKIKLLECFASEVHARLLMKS